MFRDEKKPPKGRHTINVLVANGGLGDLVCAIPALQYLTNHVYWINPLIWVPDYMKDFAKHFLPKTAIVRNYTEATKKFNSKLVGITTEWKNNKTAMRIHAVDYAYYALLDMVAPSEIDRSYPRIRASEISLKKFNLPEKYIVILATSAEKVKAMPIETMNSIVVYVKSLGYTPIFIGAEKVHTGFPGDEGRKVPIIKANFDDGINLINKTNLLELAAIIDGAKLYIGIDGGPTHVAGFTKTPIIAGYTFANPNVHILPIRDGISGKNCYFVVPPSELACRFCQTNWPLMYDHDFRDCYYDDYACTKMMTFDKFKELIDKALNEHPN